MALTQMQVIQSLGDAMSWFERELAWGVEPTEMRHLCGRIGELYVALITNGQMANEVNQKGYDVIGADGERISVKTTAMAGSSGHVSFNSNTLALVDRVIVLRINTEEMQIETLLDSPVVDAIAMMAADQGKLRTLSLSRLLKRPAVAHSVAVATSVAYQDLIVRELESGTIEIERSGMLVTPVKPLLRRLASDLNIALVNANGNSHNTRQLGTQVIKSIKALAG